MQTLKPPDDRFRHPLCWAAMMLSAVVAAVGCGKRGPALAPIDGRVTYHGKPLTFGNVMFIPESGPPATAVIKPDGSFRMMTRGHGDGAAIGRNKVRIGCYEAQSPSRKAGHSGELPLGKLLIPPKYTSCETSGITVIVRPSANTPLILNLTD